MLVSFRVKIISVYVFHFVCVRLRNADIVLDHEVSKPVSVDQNDLLRNFLGVGNSSVGEVAGGDEDSFVRLLSCQRANEALDFLSPNGLLPAFRLKVNYIQPKAVLVDHTVDAFISRSFGDFRF